MRKLFVVLAILSLASAAQANLLVNGDFELGPANNVPTGWANTGLGPAFDPIVAGNAVPPVGSLCAQHIDFNGLADEGYLCQQISGITIGSLLDAEVALAAYSGGGEDSSWHHFGLGIDPTGGTDYFGANVVKVETTGKLLRFDTDFLNLNDVVSQSSTITVFLYSKMDNDNGGWWAHGFDNGSLTEEIVPEPGSVLALGTGLIGLVSIRRRRS